MQTMTDISLSVMPFNRASQTLSPNTFILIKKQQYQHTIAMGGSIDSIFDLNEVKSMWSTQDLADFIAYNEFMYQTIYFSDVDKLSLDTNVAFFDYFELPGVRLAGQETSILDTQRSLNPLVKEKVIFFQKEYQEITKKEATESSDETFFQILPTKIPNYYVIVVEDNFSINLRVRSKRAAFISECLKFDIARVGLDGAQKSARYLAYLDTLVKQSQGILFV
jgi:hypothetical protein